MIGWISHLKKNFLERKNPLYGKHAKNMMKTDVRETDGRHTK